MCYFVRNNILVEWISFSLRNKKTDNGLSLMILRSFPINTPKLLNSFHERLTGRLSHSQTIDCEMNVTLDCFRNWRHPPVRGCGHQYLLAIQLITGNGVHHILRPSGHAGLLFELPAPSRNTVTRQCYTRFNPGLPEYTLKTLPGLNFLNFSLHRERGIWYFDTQITFQLQCRFQLMDLWFSLC